MPRGPTDQIFSEEAYALAMVAAQGWDRVINPIAGGSKNLVQAAIELVMQCEQALQVVEDELDRKLE